MSAEKQYFVYILASKKNGTLYTGMSSDLLARVYQHKHEMIGGLTQTHKVHHLVYFEVHKEPLRAIKREKQIKAWKRQ